MLRRVQLKIYEWDVRVSFCARTKYWALGVVIFTVLQGYGVLCGNIGVQYFCV